MRPGRPFVNKGGAWCPAAGPGEPWAGVPGTLSRSPGPEGRAERRKQLYAKEEAGAVGARGLPGTLRETSLCSNWSS